MCDSCILWKGAVNNKGYGHLGVRGKDWLAHRWAYTRAKGEIPEGKIVRHTCDNRLCVNPDHLITGTYTENMADAKERNRPIGRPGNTPRSLRIADIKAGLSDKQIAFKHNTSPGAIWKLRKMLEVR